MLSQEPRSGVESGITPRWNNQRTIDQLSQPARMSQTRMARKGGQGRDRRLPQPALAPGEDGRSASAVSTAGKPARTRSSSVLSQVGKTVFVLPGTALARRAPLAWRSSANPAPSAAR